MQEKIEQILEHFDFLTVHAYMLETGWGWGFDDVVPSMEQLQSTARDLLEDVAKSDRENTSSSTGGFHAHKWTWDNGVELELIFALSVGHA